MESEVCVTVRKSVEKWRFVGDFENPKKAEMHRLVAVHLRKVNSMFIILAQSC